MGRETQFARAEVAPVVAENCPIERPADSAIATVPKSPCDLAVATLTGAPALQGGVKYWVVATTDEKQTALDAKWYGSNNAQFALSPGYGWIQFSFGTPGFLVQ
jgi:hypothetical protein